MTGPARSRTSGGGPRRRWVMRVWDLLHRPQIVVAQVHPGSATVGLSVAGGPTVVLSPRDTERLCEMLGDAAAQARLDRGAR